MRRRSISSETLPACEKCDSRREHLHAILFTLTLQFRKVYCSKRFWLLRNLLRQRRREGWV